MTVSLSVARCYWQDARDFSERFDFIWEMQTHKTGRIKSFVDLFMGCECILKSHIFLGAEDENPVDIYRKIRSKGKGHKISHLTGITNFIRDRSDYEFLAERLAKFPIDIRYSLESDAIFLLAPVTRKDAQIKYQETIGNNAWVLEIRASLGRLIDAATSEFTGAVNESIEEIFEEEQLMSLFRREI